MYMDFHVSSTDCCMAHVPMLFGKKRKKEKLH